MEAYCKAHTESTSMRHTQWHFWFASCSSGCLYFQSWVNNPCLSGTSSPLENDPHHLIQEASLSSLLSSPSEIYRGFGVAMRGRGCLTEVFPNGSHMSSWWSGKGEYIQTRWRPRWASCGKMTMREPFAKMCSEVPLQISLSCVCFGERKWHLNQRHLHKRLKTKVPGHPLTDLNLLPRSKQHDIVE